MKRHLANLAALPALLSLAVLSGCIPPPRNYRYHAPAPAPCSPPVSPIRYQTLVTSINLNATYTPKDLQGGRQYTQEDEFSYLNQIGRADGNNFVPQNGQQVNFYLTFTINNDGQDHYTGGVQLSGWGQGNIHYFSTQYPYADPTQMFHDLTDQAYTFIHEGWHDNRAKCKQ